MAAEYRVLSSSVGQTFTGSIAKVLALGANDGESTLSNIDFGYFSQPESQFSPVNKISTNVQVPAGSYVDGPIGRLKVVEGGFLIYFNH
jgi:hypothetical protein